MRIKLKAHIKGAEKAAEKIAVSTEVIKLDAFLKFANIAESGGTAKRLVKEGLVSVNGEPCFQRGRKLRPGDKVAAEGRIFEITADI